MPDASLAKAQNNRVFDISTSTIVKILLSILFVACLKILAPLLMTLFLSILVAVSLNPVPRWLMKKGFSKRIAIAFVTILLAGGLLTFFAIVLPELFKQFTTFVSHLPELRDKLMESMSKANPLRSVIEKSLDQHTSLPKSAMDVLPIINAGSVALGGLAQIFLIFVFSIYLIIDGPDVINWINAFFKTENQSKIEQTAKEISPIISAYVMGQLITSTISFFYVLICLSILEVPSVLLLATLAAIFDVLPVLGFFLAVIPAMIFASALSGTTALIVLLLYIIYHAIENYFIIPAIYGSRLRVSGFVVLVSLIAAGLLAGVEGAVAVLPVVASFPIIERIWLKRYVGSETVAEHAVLKEL